MHIRIPRPDASFCRHIRPWCMGTINHNGVMCPSHILWQRSMQVYRASIEYLGHSIDCTSLRYNKNKVDAVRNFLFSTNVLISPNFTLFLDTVATNIGSEAALTPRVLFAIPHMDRLVRVICHELSVRRISCSPSSPWANHTVVFPSSFSVRMRKVNDEINNNACTDLAYFMQANPIYPFFFPIPPPHTIFLLVI